MEGEGSEKEQEVMDKEGVKVEPHIHQSLWWKCERRENWHG